MRVIYLTGKVYEKTAKEEAIKEIVLIEAPLQPKGRFHRQSHKDEVSEGLYGFLKANNHDFYYRDMPNKVIE